MTNYRILKKNSRIGWIYWIQKKYFNLFWLNIQEQPQTYGIASAQEKLKEITEREKEFAERKKIGNSVV